MPSCFQLTLRGESEPMNLIKVDEMICSHFNAPVDADKWYENWYNEIGLGLAMGRTWEQIKDTYSKWPEVVAIADYLEATFTTNSWYERR